MRIRWFWGLAVLPLLAITPSGMASLLPTSWILAVGVDTFGPGGGGQSTGFVVPQPSFHSQSTLTFGGSTISAQYDIEILQSMAEYNVQTQISCGNVQGDIPRCATSGRIFVMPTTDVWIEMTSVFNYSLPSDLMTINARIAAVKSDLTVAYVSEGANDNTVSSPPHSGVFDLHGSGLIPAGTLTRIEYAFDTKFLTGAANISALSTGTMHMTMTAVPEPAAVGWLAACGLILVRKRTQRDNLSGR